MTSHMGTDRQAADPLHGTDQETRRRTDGRAWEWLMAAYEQQGADWLRQEVFDHVARASFRNAIDELVALQAEILVSIGRSGEPTHAQRSGAWQMARDAINERRVVDRAREIMESSAGESSAPSRPWVPTRSAQYTPAREDDRLLRRSEEGDAS